MIKDILTSLRAIIAGYFFDVIGILMVRILLSFTPLKEVYIVSLLTSCLFNFVGGYVAASVSRKYRFINSAIVGFIHIFWALYMAGYSESFHLIVVQILAIPFALLGGVLCIRKNPVVRESEQI